jgi:ubiquinone/menaquinone biosynthesis C-methylase UbiE
MVTATPATASPDVAQQSARLLGHFAGYVATWDIEFGLRTGMLQAIAHQPDGLSGAELAAQFNYDPLYTLVWCRSAYAAGLLDRTGNDRYQLAPHLHTLLLNPDAPGYLGGIARVFVGMRETFMDLREFVLSGRREWWSDMSPEWVDAVGDAGQSFYRRMLNLAVPKMPAVEAALQRGGVVLDLACGVCRGPAKIAEAYPNTRFIAVDGDAYTLEAAASVLETAGLRDRFELIHSSLEDLTLERKADLAIINISLHEARDIGRVVDNTRKALRPGGVFVINEFPFPETIEGCRALPAQIMSGIQFFEAHIGCQLLPTSRFVELLQEARFQDIATIDLSPVHVVIHGTA